MAAADSQSWHTPCESAGMFSTSAPFVTACAQLHKGMQEIGSFLIELSDRTANPELRQRLREEAAERAGQSVRLRRIFAVMELPPEPSRCPLLASLLDSARSRLKTAGAADKETIITDIAIQLGSYEVAAHELLQDELPTALPVSPLVKTSLQKARATSSKWQAFLKSQVRPEKFAA